MTVKTQHQHTSCDPETSDLKKTEANIQTHAQGGKLQSPEGRTKKLTKEARHLRFLLEAMGLKLTP